MLLRELNSNNFLINTPNDSLNDYINSHKWKIEEVVIYDQPLKLAGQSGEEREFSVERYQLAHGEEQISQYMLTSTTTEKIKAVFYTIKLDYGPKEIPNLRDSTRAYVGKVSID